MTRFGHNKSPLLGVLECKMNAWHTYLPILKYSEFKK